MLTRREFTLVILTFLTTTGLATLGQSNAQSAAKKSPMASIAIDWSSVQSRPSATGSGRRFIAGPTSTLDNLDCHASTLNPGATNHEILTRPDDEVVIVKEGTIEAYVTDKWIRLGPGSVIFNARNTPQSMRNVGDTPATYHVISFRAMQQPSQPATQQ